MKFIIFFLLFTLSAARFARYKPLLCDTKDTYKLCNASIHSDYMVGNRSIYIAYKFQLFIENGIQFCAYRSGKLIVPSTQLDLEQWESILKIVPSTPLDLEQGESILNNYINW